MRQRIRIILGLIVLLAACAAAGSLQATTPLIDLETGSSLFTSFKAHKVGDVVTIIIAEQTSADASSEVETKAKADMKGGPGLGFLQPFSAWGMSTENNHKGDGTTSRSGNLRGEISVTITEVLPNGNYRLVGARSVDINGDRQLIEISGICRPRDILPDNTILSTYIADAQIAYSGTGMLQDAAQPGLLTRIVNWLF